MTEDDVQSQLRHSFHWQATANREFHSGRWSSVFGIEAVHGCMATAGTCRSGYPRSGSRFAGMGVGSANDPMDAPDCAHLVLQEELPGSLRVMARLLDVEDGRRGRDGESGPRGDGVQLSDDLRKSKGQMSPNGSTKASSSDDLCVGRHDFPLPLPLRRRRARVELLRLERILQPVVHRRGHGFYAFLVPLERRLVPRVPQVPVRAAVMGEQSQVNDEFSGPSRGWKASGRTGNWARRPEQSASKT
ncbi:hypothetical protein DFJ74DRAFT_261793 [Hyaloraphidium curvatum]|nr:hypothetical protein DFJ74DRAFT_261793 [Hyaloraphidium curvatum]